MSTAAPTSSPLPASPLSYPTFRSLWIAGIVASTGMAMAGVGSAWLMVSLGGGTLEVSLIQAATSLPMVVFALPAGALADIADRRRYLLATAAATIVLALVLAAVTASGWMTRTSLLAFVLAMGSITALNAPAWQATLPELVPVEALATAIALNGAGINVARAVGPAVGGVVVSSLGVPVAYVAYGLSFVVSLLAVLGWRREVRPNALPAERFVAAMRAGLRYVEAWPPVRGMMVRSAALFLFASAPWSLLPIVARERLGGGPSAYGGLLGMLGVGALFGAFTLPRLRARLSGDAMLALAAALFGASTAALAFMTNLYAAGAVLVLAGVAWLALQSTTQVAVQRAVPQWVRARAVSLQMVAVFGAMAVGGALWGAVAARTSLQWALVAAGVGHVLPILLGFALPLPRVTTSALAPSHHLADPHVDHEVKLDEGPILVTVRYRVDPDEAEAFLSAMSELGRVRRRDGAITWGIYEDTGHEGAYLEMFVVGSWLEHLHQHERMTIEGQEVHAKVLAFHRGEARPEVAHFASRSGQRPHHGHG